MKKKKEQKKDNKLKPILPTLRDKKRFIKIEIESCEKFDFQNLSSGFSKVLFKFLGFFKFANSQIWILKDKFDFEKQTFVMKTSLKEKDLVVGCISLLTSLNSKSCNMKILRISGTLKGVEKEPKFTCKI